MQVNDPIAFVTNRRPVLEASWVILSKWQFGLSYARRYGTWFDRRENNAESPTE